MKPLLLVVALGLPAAALAQQVSPDQLTQRLDSIVAQQEGNWTSDQFGLRYECWYTLRRPAGLYRSLADARAGSAAFRLQAGNEVYRAARDLIATNGQQWLSVVRHNYQTRQGPLPGMDTRVYYLPAAAVQNRAGEISCSCLKQFAGNLHIGVAQVQNF